MSSSILPPSPKRHHKYPTFRQPPRLPLPLDSAYLYRERPQHQQPRERRLTWRVGKKASLSSFTHLPLDIFYEIVRQLHPQDLLNLSRSTRRLRQLLMTRDAHFVWKFTLSNVEGLPPCPSDLSEPQFVNLAFGQHCHLCLAPRVKDVFWGCRIRSCKNCLSKCFLTIDQLVSHLPNISDFPNPETIFLHATFPKAKPGNAGTILFYKPLAESYLEELDKLDKNDSHTLLRWYNAKQIVLDKTTAHAALCERWARYWTYSDTSHQLYDYAFTLCLLGLLIFLWKDKLLG